ACAGFFASALSWPAATDGCASKLVASSDVSIATDASIAGGACPKVGTDEPEADPPSVPGLGGSEALTTSGLGSGFLPKMMYRPTRMPPPAITSRINTSAIRPGGVATGPVPGICLASLGTPDETPGPPSRRSAPSPGPCTMPGVGTAALDGVGTCCAMPG